MVKRAICIFSRFAKLADQALGPDPRHGVLGTQIVGAINGSTSEEATGRRADELLQGERYAMIFKGEAGSSPAG
jgi:hypothetical protein